MKYPHVPHSPKMDATRYNCRCGASTYVGGAHYTGWGDHCPAAMLERIVELEAEQASRHKAVAGALEAVAEQLGLGTLIRLETP